jgi:hypothetical protein
MNESRMEAAQDYINEAIANMDPSDLIEKIGGLEQIIIDNYEEALQIIQEIEHEKTARRKEE